MPISISVPNAPNLPLPTDIMARMAASQLDRTRAQVAQQTALPLAQQLLASRQQTMQQGAQSFPLMQQLRQAQIALDPAKAAYFRTQAQQIPIRNAIARIEARAKLLKATEPHLTPTQAALRSFHDAFNKNPNSVDTVVLGKHIGKLLAQSKGASITTPGGTTVTLGGQQPAAGISTFFPQAGQTVGGQPQTAPAQVPAQLTPQQQQLQRIFGVQTTQPSALSQVGGIGGSRKQQGITLVDPKTGQAVTTPTRQVTTLNQNAVESAQKLAPLIKKIVAGFAPFSGIQGATQKIFDKVVSGLGVDNAISLKIQRMNEAADDAKIGATDLIRAVGAPNTVETEEKFEKIFIPRFGENPTTYRNRVINGVTNTVQEFAGTAAAAQVRGIVLGTIKPGSSQFSPAVTEGSTQIAPRKFNNLKSASTAQLIQQFGGR